MMSFKSIFGRPSVLVVAVITLTISPAGAETSKSRIESALTTIRVLERPGRDNLATVWDGNKYVQCRRLQGGALRCEAAGALMQTSLAHVLTPEHVGRLATLGWMLDPSFGNYVQSFPADAGAEEIADKILAALSEGYDADLQNLEIETTSIAHEPCPPRNGPSQNLAGMINDAPAMKAFSVHGCAYTAAANEPRHKLGPGSTAAELIEVHGLRVAAEIERLRINMRRNVFAVFDTGLGYVQCQPQTEPNAFYCEAQSADSWPALAAVLTPERIARLRAVGFADPGRAPNYSKTYRADEISDAALASEVLTLLHDVYGYYGASKLDVITEERK
jgi:type III secretion system-like peptide-binding chaperone